MGHWLPSQDLMMRATWVEAGGEVKDDGSRVVAGYCPEAVDRCFFHGLEQGRPEAPKSKLLASTYLTVSLSH